MTGSVIDEPTAGPERGSSLKGGQTPESLERDAQALMLRSFHYSLAEIDAQLKYGGTGNVSRALKRAEKRILSKSLDAYVATEMAKLDQISLRLIGILSRRHVVVSGGKIVYDNGDPLTGRQPEPLADDSIEMKALAELVRVSESKRRLLGMDAAAKLDINLGESEVDAEIAKLMQAMEANGRAMEQRAARGES